MNSNITVNPTANLGASWYGNYTFAGVPDSNDGTITGGLAGGYFQADFAGTGSLASFVGISGSATNSGAANVTSATAVLASPATSSSGTTSSLYAFRSSPSAANTSTATYPYGFL